MPHLTVEYSANTRDPVDTAALLRELHGVMETFDTFRIADVKSRCLRLDHFRVGTGDPASAFVHVRLEILSGRDPQTKKTVAGKLRAVIERAFARSARELALDVSIEIRDMARDSYFKG